MYNPMVSLSLALILVVWTTQHVLISDIFHFLAFSTVFLSSKLPYSSVFRLFHWKSISSLNSIVVMLRYVEEQGPLLFRPEFGLLSGSTTAAILRAWEFEFFCANQSIDLQSNDNCNRSRKIPLMGQYKWLNTQRTRLAAELAPNGSIEYAWRLCP